MNFWNKLTKPIIGLSPMDGVSDVAFRYINAKYGKPDVTITEFISVDGIAHSAERLFVDFLYHQIERPVVAQVFGNEPQLFYIAAKVICELGFDGMDINMGCPAKSVAGRGAGAALIKTPDLALEIMRASKKGIADWVENGISGLKPKLQDVVKRTKSKLVELGVEFSKQRENIPLSVKTRVGFSEIVVETWMENLLQGEPACLTVHGRTLKQLYSGQADWEAINRGGEIVAAYNQDSLNKTVYLGNGDINSPQTALEKLQKYNIDGLLIGRGTYGNPWIFQEIKAALNGNIYNKNIGLSELMQLGLEHAKIHVALKGESSYVQMRKHLAWYVKGFPHAAELRVKLLQTNSIKELEYIINSDFNTA